jgi:hypothetical protein
MQIEDSWLPPCPSECNRHAVEIANNSGQFREEITPLSALKDRSDVPELEDW